MAPLQLPHREPIHDIHPLTGVNIAVFYADRALETFGGGEAGWFWWPRRRGFSPDGPPTGPFPSCYAAYRHAMIMFSGDEERALDGPTTLMRTQCGHANLLNCRDIA
jgi:hypothetical protein